MAATISPRVLGFLTHLTANNSKAWMDERRDFYHESKAEVLAFGQGVVDNLAIVNPVMKDVEIRKCIFRINRDIRFSKNKKPYKNNFALYIAPGGTKSTYAGLYIHIQPKNQSMVGSGIYSADREQLKLMRDHIVENYQRLDAILADPDFKRVFGKLQGKKRKVMPRGYDKTHPSAKYLMQDSRYVMKPYTDKQITAKMINTKLVSDYMILKPFSDFCNAIVDASTYS